MNKILEGRNYGSIPHLLDSKLGEHDKYIHEGQDAIIRKGGRDRNDTVHVSLKLDGTNVGVIRRGEELFAIQRKGFLCDSSPYKQHHAFADFVRENRQQFFQILNDGERIAGEWLYQASGILYDVNGPAFFPFDIFDRDNNRLSWSDTNVIVMGNSNFECPPSYSYGFKDTPFTTSFLFDLFSGLCKATPIDGQIHEGLVYRVERNGHFDFMAKWVRDDFEPGRYLPGVRDNAFEEITLNKLR